jgi:predicted XRE-type DNA-binding protein
MRKKVDTASRHRTEANGNVYAELGFPADEARRLLRETDAEIDETIRIKRQLMDEIAQWIKSGKVTQTAAAQVLQVTRPRVSDVVNHKVQKFTIDALVAMVSRIGKQVQLAVR